jgi:hypothetical protein
VLYTKFNFRMIAYDVNMSVGEAIDGHYSLYELVLMKDDLWNFL